MSKLSLLNFLVQPGEVVRGVRRLGGRGALMHGVRRASASMERALLGPAQLRINPMGVVCNHRCPMCWLMHIEPGELRSLQREDREQGMDLEDYKRLFAGMPPGLTEVNVVGGGEPLVHKQCVQIMEEIKRLGVRGYLISNGTLLDEGTAEAMVKMGWDRTRISTHAGDAETYAMVQGVDHFDRLRSNLQTYDRIRREAGVQEDCQLHVHHVIQRENLETIPADVPNSGRRTSGRIYVVFERVFAALAGASGSPQGELGARRRAPRPRVRAADAASPPTRSRYVAQMRAEVADAPEEPLPAPPREPTEADRGVELGARSRARGRWRKAGPRRAHRSTSEPHRATLPDEPPFKPREPLLGRLRLDVHPLERATCMPCCFSNEVHGQRPRAVASHEVWFGEKYADVPQATHPRRVRGVLLERALQAHELPARLGPARGAGGPSPGPPLSGHLPLRGWSHSRRSPSW